MTPLKKLLTGTTSLSHPGHLARVPAVVAAIGGALGITGTVGTFLLTAAVTIGISAVTSWALAALMPKPSMYGSSRGTLVNSREAAAAQEYVYGTVRKGGVITYMEATGGENEFLHIILCLAGHEVASIGNIYINDQIATLDGNGFVTSQSWNSKIRIKKYTGSQTTAPVDLLAESGQIGSSFVGNGIAYLYIRLEYDQDTFPNGVPLFTAIVNGKKVYDPRSASTSHSANAALCVRDYITAAYGLGDTGVDETVFAVAANICDENVTLAAGGTEKRYTMNGVLTADQTPGDVLQTMMTACAGTLFWGQGNWQLKTGHYTNPVKTFTLDDFRGSIQLQTRQSMADTFNVVRGTFNDKAQDYIVVDYPEITNAAYLTEDNDVETPIDLSLPYTTSAATAQRIAALTLNRGREQITLTADFSVAAFGVQVGDVVAITNGRYGWTAKEFEVVGWLFFANDSAGDLRVKLTLRETSESAFDWNADETAIVGNNTTLPVFNTVPAPTNLTLTATTVLNDDGIAIPAINASWLAPADRFVQFYEVQYKRLGGEEDYGLIADAQTESVDWGSIDVAATETEDWGLTGEVIVSPDNDYVSVLGTTTSFLIQPVLNGYDYYVRVRAVNSLGVRSPFISSTVFPIGDTTPPGTPSNLTASPGVKYIELRWLNPADQDFAYTEVWENTVNDLTTATQIGQSSGSNYIRANLSNDTTLFYWVRAVDSSLNKSPFTSSMTATTLLIAPEDFDSAVNDLFTEAGAFGVEPVSSLPATGAFDGKLVLLLPDVTIYRWDATTSEWSTTVYAASSIGDGSIVYNSFASGIEPVGVVSTLPTVAGYVGPKIVVLTTDGKLYRLVSGAWTATVPASDLTGQITATQITDDSVTTAKIAADAVVAGKIAAGAVNASQIATDAVTADKILAGSIITSKIATGAVTATNLAANSVTAANGAIANLAVTTAKIADSAITSAKIADAQITSAKIADAQITSAKIGSVIESDNFVAGSTGWQITKAGAAEFNSLVVRESMIVNGAISDLVEATRASFAQSGSAAEATALSVVVPTEWLGSPVEIFFEFMVASATTTQTTATFGILVTPPAGGGIGGGTTPFYVNPMETVTAPPSTTSPKKYVSRIHLTRFNGTYALRVDTGSTVAVNFTAMSLTARRLKK